jgi:FkbM family methyltransferase
MPHRKPSLRRFRRRLRQLINRFGYDVRRINSGQPGLRPEVDMRRLLDTESPMIFDVGANVGQSIELFRSEFPACEIHAFEPSAGTFDALTARAGGLDRVHLWNLAVGSASGKLPLRENEISEMTSFLNLGHSGWGRTKGTALVDVITVDDFCERERIDRIDVLKSDTQGFELEVFRGAESTFRKEGIKLIYCEIAFVDIYENLPSPFQLIDFLADRGFEFVTFYPFHYLRGKVAWTDALFAHRTLVRD